MGIKIKGNDKLGYAVVVILGLALGLVNSWGTAVSFYAIWGCAALIAYSIGATLDEDCARKLNELMIVSGLIMIISSVTILVLHAYFAFVVVDVI